MWQPREGLLQRRSGPLRRGEGPAFLSCRSPGAAPESLQIPEDDDLKALPVADRFPVRPVEGEGGPRPGVLVARCQKRFRDKDGGRHPERTGPLVAVLNGEGVLEPGKGLLETAQGPFPPGVPEKNPARQLRGPAADPVLVLLDRADLRVSYCFFI